MLTYIGTIIGFVSLVIAVYRLVHQLQQLTGGVFRQQLIPATAPHYLDDVPAGAAE